VGDPDALLHAFTTSVGVDLREPLRPTITAPSRGFAGDDVLAGDVVHVRTSAQNWR
jgi:hypothetical protein